MELCTNAGIVSDALKYVNQKQEQIDILKMLDKRIETIEGEETTTNSVFLKANQDNAIKKMSNNNKKTSNKQQKLMRFFVQ
jgi:hypothetical protein